MLRLAAAGIFGRPRSIQRDAAELLRAVPPGRVEGREHIPSSGAFLVVLNHFQHPKIRIWWPVLILSAALPEAPHWVMTSSWTYPGWFLRNTLEPLTGWAFERVARVYDFSTLPPMPPRIHEATDRAAGVRKVFHFVRSHPSALIGLAPEGLDSPTACLGWPPPGSGRFMLGLAERLGRVLPAGISCENQELVVRFGPPFLPQLPPLTPRDQIDRLVARQVMENIARLVPAGMRGEFIGP